MPVFYTEAIPNDNEHAIAHQSWQYILNNTSPVFQRAKASNSPEFTCSTCICFFYTTFYKRLFDTHPLAEELFRDVNAQGKFLVRMITLSLTYKSDPTRYKSTLIKLAEIHNERGVKATECKRILIFFSFLSNRFLNRFPLSSFIRWNCWRSIVLVIASMLRRRNIHSNSAYCMD